MKKCLEKMEKMEKFLVMMGKIIQTISIIGQILGQAAGLADLQSATIGLKQNANGCFEVYG
jgi:hypothetical protein